MATRKLEIEVLSDEQLVNRKFISITSREFVISLQPQGYDWTVPATTKFEIIYESNNPARSENELIEIGEKDNRTVLTIHSDEPVLQVVVNGVTQLESEIFDWSELEHQKELEQQRLKAWQAEMANGVKPRELIELGIRKLKVQHTLNKPVWLGLEPYGWYWDLISGQLFEVVYTVYDSIFDTESLHLNYVDKKGVTEFTISSLDNPWPFYFDGKEF